MNVAAWAQASGSPEKLALVPAYGTPLSSHDQAVLLFSARSRYYNLLALGLREFDCNVEIDWHVFFQAVTGKPLPENDPFLTYLRATHIHIKAPLAGFAKLSWTNSQSPPPGMESKAETLRKSYSAMLTGFFPVWMPSLNGNLIDLHAKSVQKSSTGVVITQIRSDSEDQLSLDPALLVHHLSSSAPRITLEADYKFVPSPGGLVLTSMDITYRQPPSAPPIRYTLTATYTPVDNFLVPDTLTITFPNQGIFKMLLTDRIAQTEAQTVP